MTQPHDLTIADDLLYGAEEIAIFLFGDTRHRRKVYYYVEKGALPVIRVGIVICARKSRLWAWVQAQEGARLQHPSSTNGGSR